MDANDYNALSTTTNAAAKAHDPSGDWWRWALAFVLPLGLLGVAGAASSEAVARVLRPVNVLPAVHVQPAAAPAMAAFDTVAADTLVETIEPVAEVVETAEVVLPPVVAEPQYRVVETILMEVTAYCPCTKCCGPQAQGITASGLPVSHNDSQFVAADIRVLPFDTEIRIPGYHGEDGAVVPVIDRGGAIKGKRLDVYFPTHKRALEWGRQTLPVQVLERVEAE